MIPLSIRKYNIKPTWIRSFYAWYEYWKDNANSNEHTCWFIHISDSAADSKGNSITHAGLCSHIRFKNRLPMQAWLFRVSRAEFRVWCLRYVIFSERKFYLVYTYIREIRGWRFSDTYDQKYADWYLRKKHHKNNHVRLWTVLINTMTIRTRPLDLLVL